MHPNVRMFWLFGATNEEVDMINEREWKREVDDWKARTKKLEAETLALSDRIGFLEPALKLAVSERDAAREESDKQRRIRECCEKDAAGCRADLENAVSAAKRCLAAESMLKRERAEADRMRAALHPERLDVSEISTDEFVCMECQQPVSMRDGDDPTPECDHCAHALLATARSLLKDAALAPAPPKPEPTKEWREAVHAAAIPASSSGAERIAAALQLAEEALEGANGPDGELLNDAALAALQALRGGQG